MRVQALFDERTGTLTYIVYDADSRDALIIDPVLDYEASGSTTWTDSVDRVTDFARRQGLAPRAILETHAHADHLSGSQILKGRFPGAIVAIGRRITEVQEAFCKVFDLPPDFPCDGSQFDRLLEDGEELEAGTLSVRTIATPGHTPACVAYVIGDAVFTGDALFMPDMGTGRCDFPAGSADALYESITKRLYVMDDAIRIFVGHDYRPGGRELRYETTIGQQKRENIQLTSETSREDFVRFRRARDASLKAPQILFPSVQVNINAGLLPPPAPNGVRYLKIPLAGPPPTSPGPRENP